MCVSKLSEGSALLARTSRWHRTKAGSEVAEMSTERQADTHSPLRRALTLRLLCHRLQRSWVVEGAAAQSASAWDAWASSVDGSHSTGAVGLLPGQPASWCCVGGMGANGGCCVITARSELQRPAGIGTGTHPIAVPLILRKTAYNKLSVWGCPLIQQNPAASQDIDCWRGG